MRRLILPAAIGCLLVLPLVAAGDDATSSSADTPSTRPAATTRRSYLDHHEANHLREKLKSGDPGTYSEPLTAQDKSDIDKFMQQYSPKRFARFQDIPEARKEKLYKLIRVQMRTLDRLKQDDPAIYDIRMKRLPIEDKMYDLAWQIKQDDPKSAAADRKELRDEVRQFVDSSLEERRVRLERQQKHLAEQQAQVDKALANLKELTDSKDELVNRGTLGIENERADMLNNLAMPFASVRRPRDGTMPATQPSADDDDPSQ